MMNKNNLTESGQAQMAKEMQARLNDINECILEDFQSELGKVTLMLEIWLNRMGELNENN